MKTRFFSRRFFVVTFLAFLSLQTGLSAIMITDPINTTFRTPQPHSQLNIKHHDINVSITNQIATTKVTQVFHNPNNYDVEGTYIFPIPENVSISNFTMHVNEKPLTAELLDKDKARDIYEGIVRKRQDPALLEYVGRGMIQAHVYPIEAHKDMRISFEYAQILTADNGTIKYVHSLGTDKNSNVMLNNVLITMDVFSDKNIVNLYSPTHELTIKKNGQKEALVTSEEKNVGSQREFIFYYTIPHDEIGFNVLTYKKDKEDGFFLAMMSPNMKKSAQPVVAKNIMFVVDISGSMYGKKIAQAKDALKFCLQNLQEEDHFNIIAFDHRIIEHENKLIQASSSNVQKALSFVDTLDAFGSTNIDGALEKALQQIPKSDSPNIVIFLTDGQANVGESRVEKIITNAIERNKTDARIFSFGVGYGVNTALLDKLSLRNKGTSDYVRPSENIETVVSSFYSKVANPVLTDLLLRATGTTIKEFLPVALPDMFHGSQLLILGRYTNGGQVTLDLSGKQNTAEKHYHFSTQFTDNDTSNDFLPRLWAARRIAFLIDIINLEGKRQELVDEIITLSKKYGIMTEYTSFLVDVDAQTFSQRNNSYDMIQHSMLMLESASHDVVGKSAVSRSKNQKGRHDAAGLSALDGFMDDMVAADGKSVQEKVRTVRDRTFFLKDDVWIDADHTNESKITRIKRFSNEYFDLLKKDPEIGACLALGKSVIITVETGSIEVYDEEDAE